jgi:two-component system response regulator PilR (NtrC family)
VRIVSATHKDLAAEVQAGRFRQDLFYRLNVIDIKVPPLRERLVDLPAIADALLARLAREVGVAPARLSPDARALLARYAFPGNVRELENLLHRAVALSDGEMITPADLALPEALLADTRPAQAHPDANVIAAVVVDHDGSMAAEATGAAELAPAAPARAAESEPVPADLVRYLDEVEREILVRALERQNFNRTAAGASLGLSLRQMRYRMARLGITESEASDPT